MSEISPLNRDLNVALLFDDIVEAQAISNHLRDYGIFAHYYQSQDEFWIACNQNKPDLAIIDVLATMDGAVPLNKHPMIKDGSIELVFYFAENYKELINPFFSLDYLGLIKKEMNLKGQLEGVVNRFKRMHKLTNEIEVSKRSAEIQRKKINKVLNEVEEVYNFEAQFVKLEKLMNSFGAVQSRAEFMSEIERLFTEWSDCERFTFLQLSEGQKRLETPRIENSKYVFLSPMGLGRKCHNGIEVFAMNMGTQIAMDLLGHDMKVLPIMGSSENPELVILVKAFEEKVIDFRWEILTQFLSLQLQLKGSEVSNNQIEASTNIWNMMDLMEDIELSGKRERLKFFRLDFRPLLNAIQKNTAHKFQWEDFYQELKRDLSAVIHGYGEIAENGIYDFVLTLEKRKVDRSFQLINDFIKHFEYWRFFVNRNVVLTNEDLPAIKSVTPSAAHFIRSSASPSIKPLPRPERFRSIMEA
jgi:hypothetical protein